MRTIRVYSVHDKALWISPNRLLRAVLSSEPTKIVNHARGLVGHSPGMVWTTIKLTLQALHERLVGGIMQGLLGIMWGLVSIQLLMYPPVAGLFDAVTQGVLVIFFLLCVAVGSCATLSVMLTWLRFRLRRKNWSDATLFGRIPLVYGPALDPPAIAHRSVEWKRPSVANFMSALVIIICLSSIVLATPIRPALVGDQIIERSRLVVPGTLWRSVQVERFGFGYAVFAAPDMDHIWVFAMEYYVEAVDPFRIGGEEFDQWIGNRVRFYVNNISESVLRDAPVDGDAIEQTQLLRTQFENKTLHGILENALIQQFNERYEGIWRMQDVRASVKCMTLAQYQKEVQGQ